MDEKSKPKQPLISVNAALAQMLEACLSNATEQVRIEDCCQRILAEDILSQNEFPSFSNSGMDGFAVLASDTTQASLSNPISLKIVGDIPAGSVFTKTIRSGESARVMTGGTIPEGADAVVAVEQTNLSMMSSGGRLPSDVLVFQPVQSGENIRKKGQDIQAGECLLRKGQQLRPQEIGLLAMLGKNQITVYTKVKVALVSSGDELTTPGKPLEPGKIYDSNLPMLKSGLEKAGCEIMYLGLSTDQEAGLIEIFDAAIEAGAQLILSTAGVSVGAYDFVKVVVEKHGRLDLWRVNMRPGKPLAFGKYRNVMFIGLPGNPVSAYVGFEVFVRPVIMKMSGVQNWKRFTLRVKLSEAVTSDGRETYLRAYLVFDGEFWLASVNQNQNSGNLLSLVQANAFIIVPSEVKSLPIGSWVTAWPFIDWV